MMLRHKWVLSAAVVICCLLWFTVTAAVAAEAARQITVIATTDLHGNIYPYDYFTAKPAARGLAKAATLIQQVRAESQHSLLIDCGDTIQGTPLAFVHQAWVRTERYPLGLPAPGGDAFGEPMMRVMNHLGFDAMVLGNHEFNFGLKNLEKARREAHFPWLSANTRVASGTSMRPFAPYFIKEVGGVKVAIIGVTTPAIPNWEKPENYAGLTFTSPVDAVRKTYDEVRRLHAPAVIIAAVHAGLDRNLKSGELYASGVPEENAVYQIATKVPGLDAIVFGHTHQEIEEARVGEVLLTQPNNWGASIARLDFDLIEDAPGKWKVAGKRSRLLKVTASTPADATVLEIAKPYHDQAERYLATAVAKAPAALDARLGRIHDHPVVDAIHEVQLHYTGADVSFTGLFNTGLRVPAGAVTVRDLAALYIYENELYAVEGTGQMVRDALENSARYFLSCADTSCASGPLLNPKVLGFNYDTAQGVEYEIDLRQPEGQRIRNLTWKGKPLRDDEKLRIAVNNYRAGGSGGYSMFRDAKVVWKSGEEIRDLMIEYYTRQGSLPAKADRNWKLVPAAAVETLQREVARQ
jgi:2',3'-cyclic-nucleotide 2'-phosphodiesterase / 3'-nucleotidase